jgi:hypothetical protein
VVGKSEFWVARTNALQTCTSVREKITVTVNPLPGARLSVQTKNRLLPGDTTYLLVKSDTLKSISEVRWFKNSAFQPQSSDTLFKWIRFYSDLGRYEAEVVDTAGCFSRSNAIDLTAAAIPREAVYIFPNPVVQTTRLVFTAPAGQTFLQLTVIGYQGQVVKSERILANQFGSTQYDLDLSRQLPGTYEVRVQNRTGGTVFTKKLIKL